jgi:hypothetical protein
MDHESDSLTGFIFRFLRRSHLAKRVGNAYQTPVLVTARAALIANMVVTHRSKGMYRTRKLVVGQGTNLRYVRSFVADSETPLMLTEEWIPARYPA